MIVTDKEESIQSGGFEITDEELLSFTTAVKARFGIDFISYEKKSLKRGLIRLIAKYNLGSVMGLWAKVLRDREFMTLYIDELLVNLTELFRNPDAWQVIKTDILEQLMSKPSLRIWHAGCSTGEEVYTMNIVLTQKKLINKTTLIATDLSTQALNTAREGKYPVFLWDRYKASFMKYDSLATLQLPDYFALQDNEIVIHQNLKKNVRFRNHNIVQDPPEPNCDLICCRNVMIYFDETLKMNVLKQFHKALRPNGFLMIGYYDMLPEAAKGLFKTYNPSARLYQKIEQL
jgi:chemotaxis protein methyltransferase CheR